ncbi:MAG: bifunctional phosphopantothenoylcysteine decarboxylase/phosphopantothenate--cysteine ligase CoaBC [Cyanobacteria bacterium]|jgi:phosphopantothenoylcysteine decarboxylase/phosphopantothenate--cysteine ligase|nr:bifunctional phosphopantothenoylcysteine decarboxylase/phosphopantothenate--cysteine ligase CoaBC [Cyanobacteria bacterium GSL.Bin21]
MTTRKNVLIGIGGGIAAYKVCQLISHLYQTGVSVRVILTAAAQQFITPLTVSTLSRHPAYTDNDFWHNSARPLHIELGEWADLFLIAPLTANTLGKLVYGFADNLLTNTVLASRCPVAVAPAMNTQMWEHSSVQRNWQGLQADQRYHTLEPTGGLLACDRAGTGRMAEPDQLLRTVQSLLYTEGKRDFLGKTVLINGGGTQEYLDPVRFIGNPATGKMGSAIAQAAIDRGATVTLVHGGGMEVPMIPSPRFRLLSVVSAEAMSEAMLAHFPTADYTILSAAVADVKPTHYATEKLPKTDLPQCLPLTSVPDIAATLGEHKQGQQVLVGFAAQTGDFVKPAREKMERKNLDYIVANPIDRPDGGFGSNENQGIILGKEGWEQPIPLCSKLQLAHYLLDSLQANRSAPSESIVDPLRS